MLIVTSRQLLGQTPKECIAWYPFEQRFLDSFPSRVPSRCTNSNTDEETDKQYQEQRKELFSGEPSRKQLGQWPHKTAHCLHGFEQEQNGKVNWYEDDE